MKKLFLVLAASLMCAAGLFAQVVQEPVHIEFPKNDYAGPGVIEYQAKVNWLAATNNYALKKGDRVTFHIEGTTHGNFSGVKAVLCDTREAVKWWREKSDYQVVSASGKDGKSFVVDLTFKVSQNVESAAPGYCQLVLMLGQPANWDITKFSAKKE